MACPAIGVRHEPSSSNSIARSASAHHWVGASTNAATNSRTPGASSRHSTATMPCPTAGRKSSGSSVAHATSVRPRRFKPARANTVASANPSLNLAIRVSTLPRKSITRRSGRRWSSCARRRKDDVPITAFCGKSANARPSAVKRTSRGSSRGSAAASTKPGGRTVGMSFSE